MTAGSEPSAGEATRGRRPWLAFLLSLLAPGLGHVYAGSPLQAFLAVLAWALLVGASGFLFIQPLGRFAIWVAALLLVVALALFGVPVHAAWIARSGRPLKLNRWVRISIYVLYFVAFSKAAPRAASWIRTDVAEPFRVPSSAMFPTLHVGDHFFAHKRAYLDRSPERGDIIVFWVARDGAQTFAADSRPDLPRDRFVKRIVGVPGDRVRVAAGSVYLNGAKIQGGQIGSAEDSGHPLELFSESLDGHHYTVARDADLVRPDLAETVIPPERYFVMGDNRDYSNDSRNWGTVGRADIIARVSHLYYSLRPSTGSVDWARIGMRVE